MSYQELQEKYPNKEIKLISHEYKNAYLGFGFKVIEELKQNGDRLYFMAI